MNELLNSYINNKTDDKIIHISDVVGNRGVYTKPTPIGYSEIDSCLDGGVRDGDLIVLTGLSGSGKTTLAQNITLHISKNCVPIIWFSYEILLENLKAKFEQMSDKMNLNLKDVPIFVPKRNTSGNLSWIKNKIIECQKNINTKIVFIDHIDFISPTNLKNSDQRRMILKQICEELKLLAIDLKITIFLIAHVKKVQGREIEMQDIAESCLPAGSKILNAETGNYVDIEQIYKEKKFFNVIGFDNGVIQSKPIVGVVCNGVRDVYEIKTKSGLTIQSTLNHKFFDGEVWKKLSEFKVDEYLAVPGKLPSGRRNDFNINISELIGWMIGDGNFTKYGTGRITLQDEDDLKHIKKLAKNIGVCVKYKKYENWIEARFQTREDKNSRFECSNGSNRKRRSKLNQRDVINRGNKLKEVIKEIGLESITGIDKKIPEIFFSQNNKIISVLLRGLFQSDGYVSDINKRKKRYIISFSSINIELVEQVKSLLLRFGIRSRIKRNVRSGKDMSNPKKDKYIIFNLIIDGKESVNKFYKEIKLINKKGKRLEEMIRYIKNNENGIYRQLYDFLPPNFYDKFIELKKTSNITWKKLGFRICYHQKKVKKDQWNKLLYNLFKNNIKVSVNISAVNYDIDFDQIKSIKKVGCERVYDIEVEDIHNFICNDIYTHNSGIYQLADYVVSISRLKTKENVGGDIVEHDTNEGIVKVLKNRLTGKQPFFKFLMEDNVITPYLR